MDKWNTINRIILYIIVVTDPQSGSMDVIYNIIGHIIRLYTINRSLRSASNVCACTSGMMHAHRGGKIGLPTTATAASESRWPLVLPTGCFKAVRWRRPGPGYVVITHPCHCGRLAHNISYYYDIIISFYYYCYIPLWYNIII